MERKIGEIFEDNGVLLKTVTEGLCSECYYNNKLLCYASYRARFQGECLASRRTDKTGVIFKEIKTMTKSDLKPGMLLECKDGFRFLILNNKGLCAGKGFYLNLDDIKEDLTCSGNREADINKVFTLDSIQNATLNDILDTDFSKIDLLWERPKEVVLTMEQIAEKFNVDVNQLKIKK